MDAGLKNEREEEEEEFEETPNAPYLYSASPTSPPPRFSPSAPSHGQVGDSQRQRQRQKSRSRESEIGSGSRRTQQTPITPPSSHRLPDSSSAFDKQASSQTQPRHLPKGIKGDQSIMASGSSTSNIASASERRVGTGKGKAREQGDDDDEQELRRIGDDPRGFLGLRMDGEEDEVEERSDNPQKESSSSSEEDARSLISTSSSIPGSSYRSDAAYQQRRQQQSSYITRPNTSGLPHLSGNPSIPSGLSSPPMSMSNPKGQDHGSNGKSTSTRMMSGGGNSSAGMERAAPLLRSLSSGSVGRVKTSRGTGGAGGGGMGAGDEGGKGGGARSRQNPPSSWQNGLFGTGGDGDGDGDGDGNAQSSARSITTFPNPNDHNDRHDNDLATIPSHLHLRGPSSQSQRRPNNLTDLLLQPDSFRKVPVRQQSSAEIDSVSASVENSPMNSPLQKNSRKGSNNRGQDRIMSGNGPRAGTGTEERRGYGTMIPKTPSSASALIEGERRPTGSIIGAGGSSNWTKGHERTRSQGYTQGESQAGPSAVGRGGGKYDHHQDGYSLPPSRKPSGGNMRNSNGHGARTTDSSPLLGKGQQDFLHSPNFDTSTPFLRSHPYHSSNNPQTPSRNHARSRTTQTQYQDYHHHHHRNTGPLSGASSIFHSLRKKVSSAGLSLSGGGGESGRGSGSGGGVARKSGGHRGEYDDDVRFGDSTIRSPRSGRGFGSGFGLGSREDGRGTRGDSEGGGDDGLVGLWRRDSRSTETGSEDEHGQREGDSAEERDGSREGGAYERHKMDRKGDEENEMVEVEVENAVKSNGVRVWYRSYDSIDFLHDEIKDSVRVRRLRSAARKSWRGWIINAADRSTAWILVTLIGILTACVAFIVIRLEMALFDLKSGFCPSSLGATEKRCKDWMTWSRYFAKFGLDESGWGAFGAYYGIAIVLAITSSLLTVYLTASNRFDTPPESMALAGNQSQETLQPTVPQSGGDGISATAKPVTVVVTPAPDRPVAYFAAGSGIPEVKVVNAGFIIRGYLGLTTLFVKSIGLSLSVASGMSLGKEGPFVHIACAVANITIRNFGKYETNEAKKREILSAACAAGVSVAFGAPIGGTLFAWEESSYYFTHKTAWRSLFCASVAALTLRSLNPYHNGKLVLLELDYSRDHHSGSIYLVAVILGLFGGLYGGIWTMLNQIWSRKVRGKTWMKRHPIWEVLLVITITTLVSYGNHYNQMGGVEWVAQTFEECKPGSKNRLCGDQWIALRETTWTLLIRAGLAAITFGIKLPAGIFVPSLAAGAAFGRILGIALTALDRAVPGIFVPGGVVPGVYAVIGAAATLAGVTRTTVSLVVIVVELTASLDYVIPISISILVAKTLADSIVLDGIYDLCIAAAGYPFLDTKKQPRFGYAGVMDVADSTVPHLRSDCSYTIPELKIKLSEISAAGHSDGSFPCLRAFEGSAASSLPGGSPFHGLEVVGVLAVTELQSAVASLSNCPEAICNLTPEKVDSDIRASSVWSDTPGVWRDDEFSLAKFIDMAPLIVRTNAPLELVHQLFIKLGARSIVAVDAKGAYQGLILKKTYLHFLEELEQRTDIR